MYVSVSGLEEEVFPVLMDHENTAWPFSSLVVINYLRSLSDLTWRRHARGINGNGKERNPVCDITSSFMRVTMTPWKDTGKTGGAYVQRVCLN